MSLLAATAVFLIVVFFIAWLVGENIENYSIVDAVWALSFSPVVVLYALFGDGWEWRKWAIAAVVTLWSLRLGIHLTTRIASHHPDEDRRYQELRAKWPGKGRFLVFFQMQGVLVWLLTLPVFLVAGNKTDGFSMLEYAGLGLWLIGIVGEMIADAQLKKFAANHKDSKEVCDIGLWKYSRHPNYFFQSLLWWGLFLAAIPAPFGYFSVLAPLAMLFFLLRATGIPLVEKLAVEKRGDAYREYQNTTSAFVPLPPKN